MSDTFQIGANGYPEPIDAPEPTEYAMAAPYPDSLWRINPIYNNGYPFNALMAGIELAGSFQNSGLERVRIPNSVKAFGDSAFADTQLRHVRIAADATYSNGTFPSGCIITHYPSDDYEQLRDSEGRAILDKYGRRILVKKEDD